MRLRRYSPRPLAWGSNAVLERDALAEVADEDEVEGQQVRQLVAVDLEAGGLGEQCARSRSTVRFAAQPCVRRRRRVAQTPTLALPPLSPERAPKYRPSGTPARWSDRCGTPARRRLDPAKTVTAGGERSTAMPGSVGQHDDLVRSRRPDTSAGQYTPNGCASAGGVVREEARVAGQRQLDGGGRERAADRRSSAAFTVTCSLPD